MGCFAAQQRSHVARWVQGSAYQGLKAKISVKPGVQVKRFTGAEEAWKDEGEASAAYIKRIVMLCRNREVQ